jgi:hypothetical protein
LEGGRFFHDAGIEAIEDLIALVYDLAYFWKADPEQIMARPLDIFLESLAQAQRINRTLQVD